MPDIAYQTVNFHFSVRFDIDEHDTTDVKFQSVTGLDSTLETEQVNEGGQNMFHHVLPLRRKYGPLILKRGLLKPKDSKLTAWLKQAFDDQIVVPRQRVVILLLDEQHNALMRWTVNNVWPLSWKIGELNAEQGAVLIETLELNYNRLIFENA